MINLIQLKEQVEEILNDVATATYFKIEPSDEVLCLLLMIASHETNRGEFLKQLNWGPASGIYQIEPIVVENVIDYTTTRRPEFEESVIRAIIGTYVDLPLDNLINDTRLKECIRTSTVAARFQLWSIPDKIPNIYDGKSLAKYCKKWWNRGGKATEEDYFKYYKECKSVVINGR